FNSSGTQILTASRDTTARLWDIATGQQIQQFVGHNDLVTDAIFGIGDQVVITVGADTTVRVWDVATGEELRRFEGHTDWVNSVDVSPDGLSIITGSNDLTIRRWQLAHNTEEIAAWAISNRYIPPISCADRQRFQLAQADCE